MTYFGQFDSIRVQHDLQVDGDATVDGVLTTSTWDDQQVALGTVAKGASAPTDTAYKGGQVLAFDKAQDNLIYFTTQLTHRYKLNSAIEFHIHVAYPDGNAGNSRWTVTYSWANIGGVFPTETSVSATIASPAETDHHQLGEIAGAISGTGTDQGGISSVLLCSLTRDGMDELDTYDNDIYLVALDFHIELDTPGSRQEAVK